MGNRAIPPLGLWGVVLAMERAFPVLMSPSVDLAKGSCNASAQGVEELWIQQALPCLLGAMLSIATTQEEDCCRCTVVMCHHHDKARHGQAAEDGSLAFLVGKVRTQPQIYTAYASSAPMRSRELTSEFQAAVMALKVRMQARTVNVSFAAS